MKARELFDIEKYCEKQREEWESKTNETPFDKWLCIKMASKDRQIVAFTLTNAEFSALESENDLLRQILVNTLTNVYHIHDLHPHESSWEVIQEIEGVLNKKEMEYVKSMPAPKEDELWPPPIKSMTEENVTKLKEEMTVLNDLQAKLALANGTILDKDVQIQKLRKALEDIAYITDPLTGTGYNKNDTVYNIAYNALKK